MDLIFASNNLNKYEEVKLILKNHNIISLSCLKDFDIVEETGTSFKENAYLKAKHFYDKYKRAVFADDSGIVVKSLGGAPGIMSARYSGDDATYQSNNLKLINDLKQIEDKTAYFITVICFIDFFGNDYYFEGRIYGQITDEIRGTNGFGYDPIFYLPEYKKTFAELGNIKHDFSHRAKALFNFNKFLNKEV